MHIPRSPTLDILCHPCQGYLLHICNFSHVICSGDNLKYKKDIRTNERMAKYLEVYSHLPHRSRAMIQWGRI